MGKEWAGLFFPRGKNGPAHSFPGEKTDWGEIPACYTGIHRNVNDRIHYCISIQRATSRFFFSISFFVSYFSFFLDIDIDKFIYLFFRVKSRKEVFVSLRHVIFIHAEPTSKAKTKLHCLIFVFSSCTALIA